MPYREFLLWQQRARARQVERFNARQRAEHAERQWQAREAARR
jgi:hypothetical protein